LFQQHIITHTLAHTLASANQIKSEMSSVPGGIDPESSCTEGQIEGHVHCIAEPAPGILSLAQASTGSDAVSAHETTQESAAFVTDAKAFEVGAFPVWNPFLQKKSKNKIISNSAASTVSATAPVFSFSSSPALKSESASSKAYEEFYELFQSRFPEGSTTHTDFLGLMQGYAALQIPNKQLVHQAAALLNNHPDLIKAFNRFLPEDLHIVGNNALSFVIPAQSSAINHQRSVITH
jgi:histone deacetylase complex regulatory component SIN3